MHTQGRQRPRNRPCALALAGTLVLAATVGAQDFTDTAAVPDRAAFVERVKRNLLDDQDAERQYTYTERSRMFVIERVQRVVKLERLYEVYPRIERGGLYRRLVATNGVPTPAAELEAKDRKRRKEVERLLRQRATESHTQLEKRAQAEAKSRAEARAQLDAAFQVLEFRFVERSTRDGQPVLVAEFRPRAGARATSREARILQRFKGRVLISEADAQIVRVDMEALDAISLGWGLLVRVNKGSHAAIERRLVNGEVWLPAAGRLQARGRQLVVKGFELDREVEWYDYRKFVVNTQERVGLGLRRLQRRDRRRTGCGCPYTRPVRPRWSEPS